LLHVFLDVVKVRALARKTDLEREKFNISTGKPELTTTSK
jgi:hypothetical protein